MVAELLEHAVLTKESSQPKSTYEDAASLIEFKLKEILYEKIDESQSYLTAAEHRECYDGLIKSYDLNKSPKVKESKSGSSKGGESQSKSSGKSVQSEEPKFEVADSDMPQDQKENLGNDDEEPKRKTELEYDFEEFYKALFEIIDWDNPEGGDYPFDLTKPSLYSNIKDMARNIWSHVKVAYDKHALWGISHWRYQRKIFYGYAQGLESTHDVYSTKLILAVTPVEVMRKHGYGYLREIEVRRADNDLYTFKEGDFPRLRINDIEDMLILIV
uniref:Uncharacterized protein n=1 Tax=Tanacetum cinerariifolium TaxID=118510 RepID=A0A6L2K8Q0_TANCI|nr:hypothetical protein [Tanacetum cinerariifolium]